MSVDDFLARLDNVRRSGNGWTARCPAHTDRRNSLKVDAGSSGQLLAFCHAGCTFEDIVRATGSDAAPPPAPIRLKAGKPKSATAARYEVRDATGTLVAIHERSTDKRFTWRRPDGQAGLNGTRSADLPLYGSELAGTWDVSQPLVICEGEKAADAVREAGVQAVASVTGAAGTPGPGPLSVLAGMDAVVLWPDADDVGRQHMDRIADQLGAGVGSLRFVSWPDAPEHADAADVDADTIRRLVDSATPRPTVTMSATPEPSKAGEPEPLTAAAYHGVLGDLVNAMREHTEADPVAILGTLLCAAGALMGNAKTMYQGALQASNLYMTLVGETGRSRKGTSFSLVRDTLKAVASADWDSVLAPGLQSGEGLVHHLEKQAGSEYRVLLLEPEFGRLLRTMQRENSTTSSQLRNAWDGVPLGRILARESVKVSHHHVAMLGHITLPELRATLTTVDAANGFANRILWLYVRQQARVPFPQSPLALVTPFLPRLKASLTDARSFAEMTFTPEAAEAWRTFYLALDDQPSYGLHGAVTARAEAHVARLSLLYALLDCSPAVDVVHLEAATALWRYGSDSARYIFGSSTGDPVADEVLRVVDDGEATRFELRQETGVRDGARLTAALELLKSLGLVKVVKGPSGQKGGRRPDIVRRTGG